MSNVIPLFKNKNQRDNVEYRKKVAAMEMPDLLEEMARFHEEKSKAVVIKVDLLVRGIILFGYIAEKAITPELHVLAFSYKKELERLLGKNG